MGQDARRDFFDNKNFDFVEGYKILMGAVGNFLLFAEYSN